MRTYSHIVSMISNAVIYVCARSLALVAMKVMHKSALNEILIREQMDLNNNHRYAMENV